LTEKELYKKGVNIIWEMRCEFCTSDEALPFNNLPFHDKIIEDENHFLVTCPRYHALRTLLHEDTKFLLLPNENHHLLFQPEQVQHFGRYVKKIFKLRFPKKLKKSLKKISTVPQQSQETATSSD
jgi:hypothetical protein